ncbi:FadR/GntR family transcriptional regulator [Microbacterium panaciterrae]|uniref:FadR/GntR family transcriptional regulator n=1 Tax=Microbacterium panaciterrae TaxID=985759 RepID=A0ABP8P7B7_9MICO
MSGSFHPAPVPRISAAEAVFKALRTLIASDDVAIGDRLPGEIELARRFGVSRSILREALGACATLGLVETRTGSGTFVLSKTEHPQLTFGGYSAKDLIEARLQVEIPAAGFAAERRTPEQLALLQEHTKKMREEVDLRAWVRLDGHFHRAIAEASGNPVLAAIVTLMRQALDPQSEFLNLTRDRRVASDLEHDRILDAIASGSAEAARRAVAFHIEQVSLALTE